jgi:hypothetical protein
MTDIAEIVERYQATIGYARSGDVKAGETHLEALRQLEVLRPTSFRKGAASQLDFDVQSIRRQITECTRWLARQYQANAPEKTYFDLRRSRQ